MSANMPLPSSITTERALRDLCRQLQDHPLIGVDTEANSLYAYREQVCLIQISTRQQDWLIDPLAIKNLKVLETVFANPSIEKVFHAAEYDLICLKRDYDFTFVNLFDTMISARIIGRKQIGLGNMLEEYFGVKADKRFQRADWSVRPLPPDQLRYAQLDTHYLPALRDILYTLMQEQDRLVEAQEVFELLAQTTPSDIDFDPEGYWRIGAARDLSLRQMGILRELYTLRDKIARQRNQPPFKIFTDESLVNIVKNMPHHPDELVEINGVGPRNAERYGIALLQAIERGVSNPLPARPEQQRLDPDTLARYDALHRWRKQRAAERGVESDVIIPKDALWSLARVPPRSLDELNGVPGLGPWKRDHYGHELLTVLAKVLPPS